MQKWEYRVFASHLDPAELVVILNESGQEGWELVALARVTDYYPPHLIQPQATAPILDEDEVVEDEVVEDEVVEDEVVEDEVEEVVPVEAFRYVFKRPLE